MAEVVCPNSKPYYDRQCIDGYLWELTYSEMGPPDSRQNTGIKCPLCKGRIPTDDESESDGQQGDNGC